MLAVAVKVADVAPDVTVTDSGAVSRPLLVDIETRAPLLGAAPDKVMVQVAVPPLPRVVGEQDTELRVAGATSDKFAVCEIPLYEAVTLAAWLLVIVAATALNEAVLAPDATVTEPGTVSNPLLLDNVISAPPGDAACVNVTVQAEIPEEFSTLGAHETLLRVDPIATEMLAPEPLADRALPSAAAAETPVTPIATLPEALPANVAVTTATVPLPIAL